MLFLYVISLAFSAGLVGAFAQRVLTGLGYVPTFASGMWLTLAVSAGYAAIQLMGLAVLRLTMPTRARATYLTEISSHTAALALVPYLAGFQISWPQESLARVEPLVYLAVFLTIHLFFKLASFYAHLQGGISTPWEGAGMAAGGVLFVAASIFAGSTWLESAEAARSVPADTASPQALGGVVATVREMPEGAVFEVEAPDIESPALSFYWTTPPGSVELERIYVTVTMEGYDDKSYETSSVFRDNGWAETRIPADSIPRGVSKVGVRWTHRAEPNWHGIIGLRPIVYTTPEEFAGQSLQTYMAGPYWHAARPQEKMPNIVLIVIDGLGLQRTAAFGYEREVSPVLDRLAYSGLVFTNARTAGVGFENAISAILTGRRLAPPAGVAAENIVQRLHGAHWATAALSENVDVADSVPPVWADGFEFVNSQYLMPEESGGGAWGSGKTLQTARTWVAEHREVPFFLAIRVSDLSHFQELEGLPLRFGEEGKLRDLDRFDNTLSHIDTQLGALIKYIRDHDTRKNTYIMVTAADPLRFSLGPSGRLVEGTEGNVPIIISGPGVPSTRRARPVHVSDLMATIASVTGTRLEEATESRSLLQ